MIRKDTFLATIEAGNVSHANLCVGTEADVAALVEKISNKLAISQFDQHVLMPEEGSSTVPIAAIRELRHTISQKPLSTFHLVFLPRAAGLTEEAQQALLKMLEEPPSPAIFVLAVADEKSLLPTIVSRCHRIQLGHTLESADLPDVLKNYQTQPLTILFALAESLAKDPELITILDTWAVSLRKLLITDGRASSAIEGILTAKALITSTQTNKRLLLEDLFIALTNQQTKPWSLVERGVVL